MANIKFAISNFEIMLVIDSNVKTIGLSHPMYIEICKALQAGELAKAVELTDVKAHVEKVYGDNNVAVTVTETPNGEIAMEIEGHKLTGEIAKTLTLFKQAKLPMSAVIKFWKKFKANPKLGKCVDNYERQQDLLRFIAVNHLVLTPNGNFIAFKGVNPREPGDNTETGYKGKYRSQYKNEFLYELNKTAVEPAAKNITDFREPCGVGLHAGTIAYAKSYGQIRLAVEIDPADVVTVPSSNDSHLRAWRMIPRAENPDDSAPVKSFIRISGRAEVVGKTENAEGESVTAAVTEGVEEKTGVLVRLDGYGDSKINAIKLVREIAGMGLADAKAFVESCPAYVTTTATFKEAGEIVAKFAAIGATAIVMGGKEKNKNVVAKPGKRVRDRSKETPKTRWYKLVGGKLLVQRKVVCPGADWSNVKPNLTLKSGKTKAAPVAVLKGTAPMRTYYRVLADGKTVETVRAATRPPGFTGDRPKWFSKK